MHHLRHLDPIASSIPSISTWWNRLHEESSILERSDIIGERFATIKYARMYEQSQIDMFVADIKTYVVHLRDARVRLEGQLGQYSTNRSYKIGSADITPGRCFPYQIHQRVPSGWIVAQRKSISTSASLDSSPGIYLLYLVLHQDGPI